MMRKMVLVLVILLMSSGLAFAQWSAGLESGVGVYVNELGEDGINPLAIPVLGTVYYRIPQTFEIPSMGEVAIDAGVNAGWSRIASTDDPLPEGSFYTIPFLFVGEARVQAWFFKLGLGLHAWVFDLPGDLADQNGLDFASTVAAGYVLPLSEQLDLKLGVQTFTFNGEGDGVDYEVNVLNFLAGVQYAF